MKKKKELTQKEKNLEEFKRKYRDNPGYGWPCRCPSCKTFNQLKTAN